MSDETNNDASTGADSTETPEMSFAEFLETVPPGVQKKVQELRRKFLNRQLGVEDWVLRTPQLLLHCPNNLCNGDRVFRPTESSNAGVGGPVQIDRFINYRCSNCGDSTKTFALRVAFSDFGTSYGICMKFGHSPPYGPPTPTHLLRLFESDREIFLKGRQCENHGLGIGAFTYYRRIVEGHKDQILGEIIRVAKKIAPEMVAKLEAAKAEMQFSKAIESVKDAIPPVLLINGHNPLTLLHSALSEGLHAQTDEQCLELAHDIRLVLAELAERIGQALKDEAELNAAISRLMKR